MARSPRPEKGLKKGPWTPEEDQKLLAFIEQHGHGSWRALPDKAGLKRCGKSCRLRWTNYLRPDIKRGKFSLQEEQNIIQLHALLGNRWSTIASHLPKRTDNEIKNHWNTHLKKRLNKMGIDPITHKPKADAFGRCNSSILSHMAQWESARLEAEARLARESNLITPTNNLPNNNSRRPPPPPPLAVGFSSTASTSQTTTNIRAVTPRMPCLDVLKAWQGVVAAMFFPFGNSLESPTSTLSSVENTVNHNVVLASNDPSNSNIGLAKKNIPMAVANELIQGENNWTCTGHESTLDGNSLILPSYEEMGNININGGRYLDMGSRGGGENYVYEVVDLGGSSANTGGLLSDILASPKYIGDEQYNFGHEETPKSYWSCLQSLEAEVLLSDY